jgi:hypothetical protein
LSKAKITGAEFASICKDSIKTVVFKYIRSVDICAQFPENQLLFGNRSIPTELHLVFETYRREFIQDMSERDFLLEEVNVDGQCCISDMEYIPSEFGTEVNNIINERRQAEKFPILSAVEEEQYYAIKSDTEKLEYINNLKNNILT